MVQSMDWLKEMETSMAVSTEIAMEASMETSMMQLKEIMMVRSTE
jgi:hypothetical protein